MRTRTLYFLLIILAVVYFSPINVLHAQETDWQAKWIYNFNAQDKSNSWIAFRKTTTLDSLPQQAIAKIAVDSKYWLWLNGELVVFEGGLKRGPSPQDTYYDELDLTEHLKTGENTIAVLVWYFGKNGFSHHSSGRAGLIFEINDEKGNVLVQSDQSWRSRVHPGYYNDDSGSQPNYRLSESNVCFDARNDMPGWQQSGFKLRGWGDTGEYGPAGCQPWNKLVKRPIPQWKDYGLKSYTKAPQLPLTSTGDTLVCKLPYNAQVTPYLKVKAKAGLKIEMLTDDYHGGGPANLRAAYITQDGEQEYESLGWINGHEMYYIIPAGVEVLDLKYRETGYNTEFSGQFECDDPFYNTLWEKSRRTLYITMRDNYMDCPDRERAQWWGDAVNEIGESFYALCPQSQLLAKKAIIELMSWQRPDSTIFSPIPAGNYDRELPMQMLASVGYYGFWTYYFHSGDIETLRSVFPHVRTYLEVWKLGENGLVVPRKGGWTWGDWGENKDMEILFNEWYYLALKGYANMAELFSRSDDKSWAKERMDSIDANFNKTFWNGKAYRSPDYDGETDDRANALAVVSGLAKPDQFKKIQKVLKDEYHASPYMEKYVLEALYLMGLPQDALDRMKKRYDEMVDSELSTLWEGWEDQQRNFRWGTYNHAWSGGPLTMLSQYATGISPLQAGYKSFQVMPQMGSLNHIQAEVASTAGEIRVELEQTNKQFTASVGVPKGATALVGIPADKTPKSIMCDGKPVWEKNKAAQQAGIEFSDEKDNYIIYKVKEGNYNLKAIY